MTEQQKTQQQLKATAVLAKQQPLTKDDLQILRESTGIIGYLTSHHDPIKWRMEIELIDCIRKLDKTSSFLTIVLIFLTVVAAFGAVYPIIGTH
jgi:hypothetical protein